MKASIFLLSVSLSANALFAQSTETPVAPYSNISQYPTAAASIPLPDKLVQFSWVPWDQNNQNSYVLSGPSTVTLRKGQKLIISIQNPYLCPELPLFDKHSYYQMSTYISNPPWPIAGWDSDNANVLINGNDPEADSNSMTYNVDHDAPDIKTIPFYAAEVGRKTITINVQEVRTGSIFGNDSSFNLLVIVTE